ncbi:zinc-binding dehydrogenase [Halobacillus sp. ACCC02827]|uniref:zinc-binding dehydrogenase n=1 Tax=Halobacillus sp. ACCC02827 TaxID=3052090 RepID=UPI0025702272|nr:zinc-binding dehydrogenase [Halobacillus sp. ACCC02827]WJE17601.1 zinc-binding dehydrogenase [Halobacillus sp. ACCC02827]
MKAIVHERKDGLEGLQYKEMNMERPTGKDVLIKVHTAGMNRRDVAVVTKRHKGTDAPLIPGSDASGVIEAVGEDVQRFREGDEVVINPGLGWEKKSEYPPEGFEIVGLPDHGAFAEYYCCSEAHVEKKPSHLSFEEAGVLPLAALTAYRALVTRGQIKAGQTVLLPGIGSGVLTFALKFAKAKGARVIVTSRSKEKLEAALSIGADAAVMTESDWKEELAEETIDLSIESIGKATFHKSLEVLRKGGTLVTFGATTEDEVTIDIRKFFYAQQNILGSTMGSAEEFREMLSFIEENDIHPQVDKLFKPDQPVEAFEYLKNSGNFGKIGFRFQ